MQLVYGSYYFAANTAEIRISKEGLRTQAGHRYAIRERWDVTGRLEGESQAALRSAINDLELALAYDGQDLGLFHNDGSPSAHGVYNAETLGGVRVVKPPEYGDSRGAEYATYRTFSCAFEWQLHDSGIGLLSWVESVTLGGGGPLLAHVQTLHGLPQKQQLAESVPYTASQSGSAVGHLSYPSPPPPLWPLDLIKAPEIGRKAPKRYGAALLEWEVSWQYQFESVYPMLGYPTVQPNP